MTATVSEGTPENNDGRALSDRERIILRSVVDRFVQTADPVGSRSVAKRYNIGLSPASIRNTMSDLEEMGYLDHPYTSAGRVPTELGYRTYVDNLMEVASLSESEREMLEERVAKLRKDIDLLLRESSRLLGHLSDLLGVVLTPRLSTGVLERLEVVPLSSARAMFVVSVRSGLVKTIVLEVESELRRENLDRVVSILNERLVGLTLREIRDTYARRVKDLQDEDTGLVRLVLKNASELFSELPGSRRVRISGAQHIMKQPEFQEVDEVQNVMELLEHEDMVTQLLERTRGEDIDPGDSPGHAWVAIGQENQTEKAQKYSVVSAEYRVGDVVGNIGVIGPTRMRYSRMIALVESISAMLSQPSSFDS
jgi:heat-inducible transcriptional repressor